MTKHVADQPRERKEGSRIRQFVRIERESGAIGPHPSTWNLRRRPHRSAAVNRRIAEFLQRERQRHA